MIKKLKSAMLALITAAALPTTAYGETQTLTILGTDQPVGSIDPYSEGSTVGPNGPWGPTYSIGLHPWQNAYIVPAIAPGWVNVHPSPFIGLYTTSWIRIRFNMPSEFTNASMVLKMKADNRGIIAMNGVQLADITTAGVLSSPALATALQPGLNEITMTLIDWGGWVAFQYNIEITFDSDGTAVLAKANDTDADGLTDEEEGDLGTDPNNPDSDGDGLLDGAEVANGTDPTDPTSGPAIVDVDGDGVADEEDNCVETANSDQADLDADGLGDVCDDDIDGDGVANDEDVDPFNPDADDDGVGDGEDVFPLDGNEWADADQDGVGDNADPVDDSDLSPTVSINGNDSGVANGFIAEGVTLADYIRLVAGQCADGARNHGQYVSCVAKELNLLKKDGVISDEEKEALQSAAAQTSIGKKKNR